MATNPYYYGWNTKFQWAVEDPASYGTNVAAAAYNAQAFMRAITLNVNENIDRYFTAGSTYKFNPATETKGVHTPTATTTFWISKFGTGTAVYDPWILKLPIDYKNEAHDVTLWAIPANTGTASEYGNEGEPNAGNALLSATLEIGQSTSLLWRLGGMMVDRCAFRCMRGDKAEWTYDWIGQLASRQTAFTSSTAPTQDTNAPLDFADMTVGWKGEDDAGPTTITTCTGVEFTINNNLVPLDVLNDQTVERTIYGIARGPREITGTLHVNRATTTGQHWEEILLSATAAQTNPDTTIQLGELDVNCGGKAKYYFKEVVIGELPMDASFDKLQELSIPWSARWVYLELTTADTTPPTNWSQTS